MASLKKLAGQTVWYGLSNIAAKFLNQLLTPIVTRILNMPSGMADYGRFGILMSYVSFLNVIFTYGMETAYFRFSNKSGDRKKLFETSFSSLLVSSLIFGLALIIFRTPLAKFTGVTLHPEYINWCVYIIAIDTMAVIPFARLRQEERPKKYAFVRVAGIIVNISLTIYFLLWCPSHLSINPADKFAAWYRSYDNTGFMLLANLAASTVTFLLLAKEWISFRFKFDKKLWFELLAYSAPMVLIGLGGMVNETMDRIMLEKLSPVTPQLAEIQVAIYNANYKISIFVTLFINAFRMSAEPFFFSQAEDKNAPKTYARVMKWFVIVLCFAFLSTALFLDVWKLYVGKTYYEGLKVVPILLLANVCLGIYYNLSVWYKLTNKMHYGMYITFFGAAITLLINFTFIPKYGMMACAWATLAAYGSMMIVSYLLGQKYFPVPYNRKKIIAYLVTMLLLFFTEKLVMAMTDKLFIRLATASLLMYGFVRLIAFVEKKELKKMPFVGKLIN